MGQRAGDPNIAIVTWGNGPPPPVAPPPPQGCVSQPVVAGWMNVTDYPVYHDVFYYNPDVRNFIVETLTGVPAPAGS